MKPRQWLVHAKSARPSRLCQEFKLNYSVGELDGQEVACDQEPPLTPQPELSAVPPWASLKPPELPESWGDAQTLAILKLRLANKKTFNPDIWRVQPWNSGNDREGCLCSPWWWWRRRWWRRPACPDTPQEAISTTAHGTCPLNVTAIVCVHCSHTLWAVNPSQVGFPAKHTHEVVCVWVRETIVLHRPTSLKLLS
jgi:hypothetical protein